jgi:tRNA (guanine-N7-)-methyltransferase
MIDPQPPTQASSPLLDPTQFSSRLDWPLLFGNANPVEIEIGSGKGLFLANAATSRADRNFLGIEMARKYAGRAADRIAKRGLGNVRVWPGDAKFVLSQRVADRSVHAVHIYFPDPWWKKRHKKRRVVSEDLVENLARCLIAGGDVFVATDVEEYAGSIRVLIGNHPMFEEREAPLPNVPEHDLDYLTNFERKFRIEGRPIYRSRFGRVVDPA